MNIEQYHNAERKSHTVTTVDIVTQQNINSYINIAISSFISNCFKTSLEDLKNRENIPTSYLITTDGGTLLLWDSGYSTSLRRSFLFGTEDSLERPALQLCRQDIASLPNSSLCTDCWRMAPSRHRLFTQFLTVHGLLEDGTFTTSPLYPIPHCARTAGGWHLQDIASLPNSSLCTDCWRMAPSRHRLFTQFLTVHGLLEDGTFRTSPLYPIPHCARTAGGWHLQDIASLPNSSLCTDCWRMAPSRHRLFTQFLTVHGLLEDGTFKTSPLYPIPHCAWTAGGWHLQDIASLPNSSLCMDCWRMAPSRHRLFTQFLTVHGLLEDGTFKTSPLYPIPHCARTAGGWHLQDIAPLPNSALCTDCWRMAPSRHRLFTQFLTVHGLLEDGTFKTSPLYPIPLFARTAGGWHLQDIASLPNSSLCTDCWRMAPSRHRLFTQFLTVHGLLEDGTFKTSPLYPIPHCARTAGGWHLQDIASLPNSSLCTDCWRMAPSRHRLFTQFLFLHGLLEDGTFKTSPLYPIPHCARTAGGWHLQDIASLPNSSLCTDCWRMAPSRHRLFT